MAPMAGFMAKFYVFVALLHQGMLTIAIIGVLMSAVAAYFYIRVIMLMYMKDPQDTPVLSLSPALGLTLIITIVMVMVMGILPAMFVDFARVASMIL